MTGLSAFNWLRQGDGEIRGLETALYKASLKWCRGMLLGGGFAAVLRVGGCDRGLAIVINRAKGYLQDSILIVHSFILVGSRNTKTLHVA